MGSPKAKMTLFLKKIALYLALIFVLNIAVGTWLKSYESVDLKAAKVFFSELRWEDYYNLDEPIDALILGSSHAYRSYHPATIKKESGLKNAVFNFGSSAQSPVTGLFVLEEVLKKHQPKVVILDLYVMALTSDDQLDNGRINYHPMQSGGVKRDFLREGFSFSEQIKLLFFPSFVYRDHFKHKLNKLFGRNYLPVGKGQYDSNGFAFNTDTLALAKLKYDNQFSRFDIHADQMTAKNLAYTQKIIDRCKSAGIPLILMSSPMPVHSVDFIKEYKQVFAKFGSIAKKNDLPYFDYNIETMAEIKDEFHFYDDDHMNLSGAKIFSKRVGKIMTKAIE